jgi:hypothetical protein
MPDIEELMSGLRLGDARLNNRAALLVASIMQGQASATHGVQGAGNRAPWAHAMAAYRFWNNPDVELRDIYAGCQRQICELVPDKARAYVVHDFSVIDYSKHKAKQDRVQVGDRYGLGYDLYGCLVLNAAGEPLGPVLQELRCATGVLSPLSLQPIAFVDHLGQVERGVREANRILQGREVIHVMDREFDDITLQRMLKSTDSGYVIRAQHLKRNVRHQGQTTKLEIAALNVPMSKSGTVSKLGVEYDLLVGETTVEFQGWSWRGRHRGGKRIKGAPLDVRVIVAELRATEKTTHRWVLLTMLQEPALDIVRAYVWRWRVERYFYLTKIGLRLEQWRQETAERIARRLALSSLAAMVVYQLQGFADVVEEIKIIATMGGWLGRKADPIGPIVLMRGVMALVSAMSVVERYGAAGLREIARRAGLGFAIPEQKSQPLPGRRKRKR